MTLPDAAGRSRAVTDFDRNLVVTAGAGTGKTAILVERALNLIGSGRLGIGDLVAITFTEKAAAELQRRLAAALDELRLLAAGASPAGGTSAEGEAHRAYRWLAGPAGAAPPAIAERALDALVDLEAATVSTIHSFCSEILRRHPREALVDPGFTIDEGSEFDRAFEDEYARFLQTELGSPAGRTETWERVLGLPGALEAVAGLGRALAAHAIPEEAVAGGAYRPAPLDELLGDPIGALLRSCGDILDRAKDMNPNMVEYLESTRAFLRAALESGPRAMREATAPRTLDRYLEWDPPRPGARLKGVAADEVSDTATRGKRLIAMLERVDEEIIASFVEAAAPLARACRERMLASGQISFDGLLRLTRDMLSRSPEVRRELAARYRAILVDEFQDTDPLQYEILFFIAGADDESGAGRGSGADAYALGLAPGRLFIVGDPKQSIYRFRGADIEAYERAVSRVLECGGERITLSASFRSPEEIVEPVNRLFRPLIHPRTDEERLLGPPYDPITSARGPSGGGEPRVAIWTVAGPGPADDGRAAEAGAIAAFIARDAPSRARDGGRGYRSYAVIMRALTQAGLYAQALRRAGIPYLVEGGRDFYERREVADLLAFLRAVANPNDGAAVLAVMRGPLGAVPDEELARFAAAGGRLHRADGGIAEPGAFPRVERALSLLRSFRERTVGRASDDVVRAVLTETPLGLLHASHFEGAQRVANLRKLIARASEFAREGLSLERTLRIIADEFSGERAEGESPLADETLDAVRILSVHKAKGLEFEVVIVPDLGRQPNRARARGLEAAWLARAGGALAVRLEDGPLNAAAVRRSLLDRAHEEAEEKRVFYVACTRAREQLILINSRVSRHAAPWRDALAALGYTVHDGIPPEGTPSPGVRHLRIGTVAAPRPGPRPRREKPLWAEAAQRLREGAESARASAGAPLRWPAGGGDRRHAGEDPSEEGAPLDRRPRGAPRDAARLAGTIVHAALERWDFSSPERLRDLARRETRRLPAGEAEAGRGGRTLSAEVSAIVEEIIDQFLATDLPSRLRGLTILGREVPLLFRDEAGVTWTGAIDLVYRDDDVIVAADYKTDAGGSDGRTLAERYGDQIRIYVEALRRGLPGASVRGEILLLRSGAVVAI